MSDQERGWIPIRTFGNLAEAQIARGLLESEDIECYIHGEQATSMLGSAGAILGPKLMVPEDDVEQAERVLLDSDSARADPDSVHFICDPGDHHPELKDLDNLQLDLVSLTLCSVGHGAPRATIEAQLGDVVTRDDGELQLIKPDLGAVFTMDTDERLSGFFVAVKESKDQPELQAFPGFWEPGSHLKPPTPEGFAAVFGPETARDREGKALIITWHLETARVVATFDSREDLVNFFVTFGS